MSILLGWLSPIRLIFLYIDTIAFSLIDDVYELFIKIAENDVISNDMLTSVLNNIYILVGVIAFFRLAVLLVNAIIDPDKLFKKKEGLSNIFGRIVIMLVLLVFSPMIFTELSDFQSSIIDSDIIPRLILANNSTKIKPSNYLNNSGKTMQKIVITALIRPENEFFTDGEAGVQEYLAADLSDDKTNNHSDVQNYVDTSICKTNCQKAMAQYHQMMKQDATGGFKLRRLGGYIGGSTKINSENVYYYEYYAGVTTITAIFLTYVILSWSIDIAVRSVELAVLRVISPLFIATIVDPKSTASGGYFNNFLKRYGKTYADLFLKLAIISLAILLISLVQDADIWNTIMGG